jgi:hypothetical protein
MTNIIEGILTSAYSKVNSRYVNSFVPVKKELKSGKTNLSPEDNEYVELYKKVAENFNNLVSKYPVIKEINEVLHIEVLDLENLVLTYVIKDGVSSVTPGYTGDVPATYHIPLYTQNIKHLQSITADGDLSLDDIYRITRVLFIPFLQGLYNGDFSALPKDKAYLQLDNFIQVEVKGPEGVKVEGFEGNAKATVINVDGQWLMFEGFQGDPDVRYEMDIAQALKFAYLISVKIIGGAKKGLPFTQLSKHIQEYNDLKKEVLKYERSWHTLG